MTMYDGLMVLLVLFAIMTGAWRGAAWQIAPIASLVLGYFFALPLSEATKDFFGEPPLNRLFAMGAMYLAIAMGVYLVARSVRESVQRLKLEAFDAHLGAILGGVKGVLFTIAITLGLITFFPNSREMILASETSSVAARILHRISPILPQQMNVVLRPYIEKLGPLPEVEAPDSDFGEPPERRLVQPEDTQRPPVDTAFQDIPTRPRRRPPQGIPAWPEDERRPTRSTMPDDRNLFPPVDDLPPIRSTPERAPAPAPTTTQPADPFGGDDLFNADPDKALRKFQSR